MGVPTGSSASAAGLALLLACGSAPSAEDENFPNAAMADIADALTHALPASLSDDHLMDPAQRETFHNALRTLADRSTQLEAHGQRGEASFGYLSESLARDAQEALRRYEDGRSDEARFLVQELVNDCVACHSRLPSQDSALGDRMLQGVDLSELPPEERARLQVATRQFDAALDTYETLFRDPAVPPAKLDLEGHLTEYLVVNIRVKQDLSRPQEPLSALAQRADTATYLKQDLEAWVSGLRELESRKLGGSPLADARLLVLTASARDRDEGDRSNLVEELVASSLLYRSLGALDSTGAETSEAYYLLGLTETRVRHSYWLDEAGAYLEASVRADPGAPFAGQAYELLETETVEGYSGSSGVHLPQDVADRLAALRALLAAEAGGSETAD
jgi:hypothetical protein